MLIIPYKKLSPEALRGLIEDFVTRPGTDSGYTQATLYQNVEMVKRQLIRGEAVITFDQESKTANIMHVKDVQQFR